MSEVTLGGDRLGSGNKQKIAMRNYERSTHDLSYTWRSSMSAGTLVPFMNEVALPGDTFEIKLDADVMTLPTIGPLFGSYKVQLDVFEIPVRLYNAKLHMNMLNIGMDMSDIKLPQLHLNANWNTNAGKTALELAEQVQVNPSSVHAYLGQMGVGRKKQGEGGNTINRQFNAVPYLCYWDIYKNYYANKQEENGIVVNSIFQDISFEIDYMAIGGKAITTGGTALTQEDLQKGGTVRLQTKDDTKIVGSPKLDTLYLGNVYRVIDGYTLTEIEREEDTKITYRLDNYVSDRIPDGTYAVELEVENTDGKYNPSPKLKDFPLSNIDEMRTKILQFSGDTFAMGWEQASDGNCTEISATALQPYSLSLNALEYNEDVDSKWTVTQPQEGLAIKTYQSDLFNNWIDTEWIDGANGVSQVTAVDTTGDSFTIDSLNLANKVYNMLNRIALSGGSYDDWLDAVYTHDRARSVESPVYQGSLIKELGFEEVIATTVAQDQPLGQLGGRGRLTPKDKGGYIKIKTHEPSVIMGIVSLTPKIDYSQGNVWHGNLKTMNDYHKPALDEIGYQDLITDQMNYLDTSLTHGIGSGTPTYKSAGKVPAWINYMTNVNRCYGNFADENKEMFMTLNRRYEIDVLDESGVIGIKDLTTYIDPVKFNQIFADTNLDAQNFWVQIGAKVTARRKMSAKVIPNL